MKNTNMKKWVLSLAIASIATTGYAGSSSVKSETMNDTSIQTGTSVQSEMQTETTQIHSPDGENAVVETTVERERFSASNTQRIPSDSEASQNQMSATINQENVEFEEDSLALTDESEDKLESLVKNLDKSKPVSVTVEVQDPELANSSSNSAPAASDPAISSSAPSMQDSSTGYPTENSSVADRTISPADSAAIDSGDPQREARERNTQALSQYRAESVRQFLEEKGLDVVEWKVEGLPQQQSISVTSEENSPNLQQVHIVITGEVDSEGLSAL